MAKRKKRKPKAKHRRKPPAPLDEDVVSQRAEEELAAGRPRRAREGFRRLVKQDPELYRDRYVETTKLVVNECLAQGKHHEARQLLDHLGGFDVDPAELRGPRLRLAIALNDEAEVMSLAEMALESEDLPARIAAADALVLARASPAADVCTAIGHLCRQEWEEIRTVLKRIGRKSPFAHWRLFLRGCAAHYANDPGEAGRCFARLPADSVPARKAMAFKVLKGEWQVADQSAVAGACVLAGEPKLAPLLGKVQSAWKKGRHLEAYNLLDRATPLFPSLQVTAWGQLTRFFQLADLEMDDWQRERWLDEILHAKAPRKTDLGVESYLVTNIVVRHVHGFLQPEAVDEFWPHFIRNREKLLGRNARFTALCQFARALAEDPDPGHGGSPFSPHAPDADEYRRMIRSLEASAAADPAFEDAPLALLELFRALRKHSEANRLLDKLTQRFPESKAVLVEAGRRCLDRKAHVKGLGYLEKARTLDPLDAGILRQIRRGLREKAIAHFGKGTPAQVAKGRGTLEQILANTPSNPDPGESKGLILIEWSLMEETLPKSENPLAKEKYAEALREVGPHVAEFYRAVQRSILAITMGRRRVRMSMPKLTGRRDPAQGLQIFQLWQHLERNQTTISLYGSCQEWVKTYLRAATRNVHRDDRDTALQLATALGQGGFLWEELADAIIEKRLKLDRADPHFRCLSWTCHCEPPPTAAQLAKVREEALRRHDQAALEAIAHFMTHSAAETGPGHASFIEEPADFDPGFDDFGDDEDSIPSGILHEMRDILIELPHHERVAMLTSAGMPRVEAEAAAILIEAMSPGPPPGSQRKTRSKPEPKPKPKPKPKAARPKNDPGPDQFELPF